MRQTAYFVVNPIAVNNFASLFKLHASGSGLRLDIGSFFLLLAKKFAEHLHTADIAAGNAYMYMKLMDSHFVFENVFRNRYDTLILNIMRLKLRVKVKRYAMIRN